MKVDTEFILKLLRLYGVEVETLPPELESLVLFPESIQTEREIVARKLASRFFASLPEDLFLGVTKTLKYFLQKGTHTDVQEENSLERYISENRLQGKGIWANENPPLVITHDIDLNSCYRNVEKVAAIENELGISSTWHFLTSGRYSLENQLLQDLHQAGNEIGFHGTWHDIAIGFRGRDEIERFVKAGVEKLQEFRPTSFRAPALAWTPTLAEIIGQNGFRADSSLKTYNNGWNLNRAIPFNNGRLWEFPLNLQDDYLFKNLRLTNQEPLNSY